MCVAEEITNVTGCITFSLFKVYFMCADSSSGKVYIIEVRIIVLVPLISFDFDPMNAAFSNSRIKNNFYKSVVFFIYIGISFTVLS